MLLSVYYLYQKNNQGGIDVAKYQCQLEENTTVTTKQQEWINLLIENGGTDAELQEINKNSKNLLFTLCKYKKILRQRGNGYVSFVRIKKCYEDKNVEELHKLLNQLFLEYYTRDEIENFLELMNKTNTNIEDVYNKHLENPEYNLFSTLTL